MQVSRKNTFTTIRTDGGLLPADLLVRIAEGDRSIEGLTPESYHLPRSERLNEAATRAWNRLQTAWKAFREAMDALPEFDSGTTLTRERWLLILFQELGYGRLQTAKAVEIGDRTYPVSHIWQSVPIHLVSFRQELDRRTPGTRGASRVSPHSLVQEMLNRSEDFLWGFVSNGLCLRLLRDKTSLTRSACVEFDLQAMMDGQVYSDFFLLFLLCHQSRVEAPEGRTVEHCWLERWYNTSLREGTRVLDRLRDGVEQAIEALGGGFLAHPANTALRDKLRAGTLTTQDYYRQVLRFVYRLLFLFVAEDRDLLLLPAGEDARLAAARDLYTRHYSTQRLRRLAERRRTGGRHPDLYRALRLVFAKLHSGCRELALPALGSYLFAPTSTADLNDADIANADLLAAVWKLTFTTDGNVRRAVDYRNLGPEELGSVYESLLEMHPDVHLEAGKFTLQVAAGSERKTTGSYYTPAGLVQCLLDSALEPVIDERLRQAAALAGRGKREAASREVGRRGGANRENSSGQGHVISGSEGVADGHGTGGTLLSADARISEGGTLRNHRPDPPGRLFDTGEHRRGLGSGDDEGVHAVSSDRTGKSEGTGNPSDPQRQDPVADARTDRGPVAGDTGAGQDAAIPAWFLAAANEWRRLNPSSAPPPASLPPLPYPLLAEHALLSLKVCDPACGSGHFLIAAARRIARRLAAIRAGEEEPAPQTVQHALRDVIGRCIYGVDINPMAVELCKINLWMEALEPGKPLTFLDHHIRCGNSLLGTTPALMKRGIPDEAFTPIEGDDRAYCSELRRLNRRERRDRAAGQGSLFWPWERLGDLASAMVNLDDMPDDTPRAVQAKQERYEELVRSSGYLFSRLWADAWCAAFVWRKVRERDGGLPFAITEEVFRGIERNPHSVPLWLKDEIQRLARQYRFFHWHLEFPDVFRPAGQRIDQAPTASNRQRLEVEAGESVEAAPLATGQSPIAAGPQGWLGGFDCVLGNPPWERVKLQEKEWFAQRDPGVANAPNAAARKRAIADLKATNPALYDAFLADLRQAEGESHLLRNGGFYPLCGRGDVNTYAVFAELNRNLIGPTGRVGCIVPSGIATDDTNKLFFRDLMDSGSLVSLYDFENRKGLFPAIDSRMKFALLTLTGQDRRAATARFVFFAQEVEDLDEPGRAFTLSPSDFALLNPNTRTCPVFRSVRDAELTKAIYRRVPVLVKEARNGQPEENPWGVKFATMFHMSNDSQLFRTRERLEAEGFVLEGNIFRKKERLANGQWRVVEEYLPLYEAKMLHHFDHRWATYVSDTDTRDATDAEKADPHFVVQPRYWVPREEVASRLADRWDRGWLMGWRDITNSTNERTTIAAMLPRVGVGNKIPVVLSLTLGANACLITTGLSAVIADYASRQKLGGTTMNFFYFKQLPVLPPSAYERPCPWEPSLTVADFLKPRVLELVYTAWDLQPFARDMGYDGPPFAWDVERRFQLRCELDAAFFHLYLPSTADGDWRSADGDPADTPLAPGHSPLAESPDQLAELRKHFLAPRDAVAYIMETFPIVKRKDVEKYGTCRTKDTILEIYDEMQRVMAGNAAAVAAGRQPTVRYRTRLDPPPGPPADPAGNFIPTRDWDPDNWPGHIHRPRESADAPDAGASPAAAPDSPATKEDDRR